MPLNPYDPDDGDPIRAAGLRSGVFPVVSPVADALYRQRPLVRARESYPDNVWVRPLPLGGKLRHLIYECVNDVPKAVMISGVPVVFSFGDHVSSATHPMLRILLAGIPLRGTGEWMPG